MTEISKKKCVRVKETGSLEEVEGKACVIVLFEGQETSKVEDKDG